MVNVISDIAGNYKTLMALLEKMPDEETISIGDMVDRGPRSKEVIEWFMNNGKAVLGNHEHMMLCSSRKNRFYPFHSWFANGGKHTYDSFGGVVPEEVLAWVESLPSYIIIDDVFISHAFMPPHYSLEEACDLGKDANDYQSEMSIIWSREYPKRRDEYKIQVAGHNSHFGLREFRDDQGTYAICIDDSNNKMLTGINIPTMKIYQQEYIDEK